MYFKKAFTLLGFAVTAVQISYAQNTINAARIDVVAEAKNDLIVHVKKPSLL